MRRLLRNLIDGHPTARIIYKTASKCYIKTKINKRNNAKGIICFGNERQLIIKKNKRRKKTTNSKEIIVIEVPSSQP